MMLDIKKTSLTFLERFNELNVYAKLENTNPTCTIKYRTARRMILDAIDAGQLRSGMGIIEHTSGNTGIALAYIGQQLGYPVTIVTGSGVSRDAKKLMRQYGVEPVSVGGWFAASQKEVERRMAARPDFYYWPNQVANQSSLASNFDLGIEIACHLVLPGGDDYTGVDDKEHSTVPLPLFDFSIVDEKIRVSESEAIEAAKRLHGDYGQYVGISSGAVFEAARKISEKESGNAVIIFPDSGSRYTDVLGAG